MNKQLPEDIMKKIEQEADDFANDKGYDEAKRVYKHETSCASACRGSFVEGVEFGFMAGRTASVQPLIEALQKISDRKRSLIFPFDVYKDNDAARKMGVALNDIDELATEALSSFPSNKYEPLEKQVVELLGVCGKLNVLECIEYVKQLQANQKQ